jgi:hypothetical protein
MHPRIIDLDGGVVAQTALCQRLGPAVHELRCWRLAVRHGCSWRRFAQFERALDEHVAADGPGPWLNLLGASDLHHVSLALLRRLTAPCNLLVLDDRPDWLRALPGIRAGTWLRHAARLPQVRHVFHVGGNSGFDDWRRWLAPTDLLASGKITVLPAARRLHWRWPAQPLRTNAYRRCDLGRLETLLAPFRDVLEQFPLYISLDKRVLVLRDAIVGGRAGCMWLDEMLDVIEMFLRLSGDRLAGMDIAGDWQPTAPSAMTGDAAQRLRRAAERALLQNERANLRIVGRLLQTEPLVQSARIAA